MSVNCTQSLCARPEVLRAPVIWDDLTVLDLRQMEPDAELNSCRLLTAVWQQSGEAVVSSGSMSLAFNEPLISSYSLSPKSPKTRNESPKQICY